MDNSSHKLSSSQQAKFGGSVVDNEVDGSVDFNEGVVPSVPELENTPDDNEDDNEVEGSADDVIDNTPIDAWVFEGVEGLGNDAVRHMNTFYALLNAWYSKKDYTSILMTRKDYYERVAFGLYLNNGGDCRSKVVAGMTSAYKWASKYHVLSVGEESAVLVIRPKKSAVDVTMMDVYTLQQPTYAEKLYADLWKIHKVDHCRGLTLYNRARDKHGNVSREICKMFTDVCPHCIQAASRKKPVAGIKNMVTDGFGVRGQVDLIDFQSMPDGSFKYLLNYIDHGVKKLTSIPLTSKRAVSVAFALYCIFTEQGPPSILQTDNGGEFSGHAHDHIGRRMVLDDEFVDMVIKEVKNFWPECMMVRGSPRHSESNGGVERVNQTVQKKLGGWMTTNKSKHWSIGCKMVQWRINTQIHQTLKDSPYHLTYGQHPRVGISNLPVMANVLARLVTEGQLHDVYSQLFPQDNSTNVMDKVAETNESDVPAETTNTLDVAAETTDTLDIPIAPLGKRKGRTPKECSIAIRNERANKRMAIESEVLGNDTSLAEPLSPVDSPSTGKTSGLTVDDYRAHWLGLIQCRDIILDIDEIANARINSVFPIIYCTNNKDITDMANWSPCILRKIRKDQYEVLDDQERDKLQDDLDWVGDEGLSASWGMYYKYPNEEFLVALRNQHEEDINDKDKNDFSPNRLSLRNQATANVRKKADSVNATVLKKSPTQAFKLMDVVLVPLDDVDRTKVDGPGIAGVIVSIDKAKSSCRVAVKQGVLHRAYVYHSLKPVPKDSNNLDVMDLRDAYDNWRSLPKITEREAARYVSSVGGQGIVHCNCRGSCLTMSCSCKKAGRLCSSRCHRNSKCCKNTHEEE